MPAVGRHRLREPRIPRRGPDWPVRHPFLSRSQRLGRRRSAKTLGIPGRPALAPETANTARSNSKDLDASAHARFRQSHRQPFSFFLEGLLRTCWDRRHKQVPQASDTLTLALDLILRTPLSGRSRQKHCQPPCNTCVSPLLARSPSCPRHELRTKHLHDSLPWQDQQPGYGSQLSVTKLSSSALSRSLWSTKPTRAVGVPGVRRISARPRWVL